MVHLMQRATQLVPQDLCTRPEQRIICAQEEDLIAARLRQRACRSTVCLEPPFYSIWQERPWKKPVLAECLDFHSLVKMDR